MKFTIFGGSFDPIHKGHKAIVKAALEQGLAKRIIVMPLGLAPHKKRYMSMATYRLHMTELAMSKFPEVQISDYEIKRPGRYSYTIDTIRHFKEEFANRAKKVKIVLLYGSDALYTIEDWHKPAEIMREARLLVAMRGDEDIAKAEMRAQELRDKYGAKIKLFTMPPHNISSTEIRDKIKRGEDYKKDLPKKVYNFIEQNKIYAFSDDLAELTPEERIKLAQLENKVAPLMPRARMIHTLNVMNYAVHLASVHGVDRYAAAAAAVLHDCAKYLPIKKQLKYAKKAGSPGVLNQAIAHGPAGSYYAKRFLGIKDHRILSAVFFHTTARPFMPPLEQIIYLSDKIEFGRGFDDLDPIRELAEKDLNKAMKLCLSEVEEAFARRNKKIHPMTKAALTSL